MPSCPPELTRAASTAGATRRTAIVGAAATAAVAATGAVLDPVLADPGHGGSGGKGSPTTPLHPKKHKKKKKKKLPASGSTATPKAAPTPTAAPTQPPSVAPTTAPTAAPTLDPTPESSPSADATPTSAPTSAPSASPTSRPSGTPTTGAPTTGPSTPTSTAKPTPKPVPFTLVPDDHTRQVLSRFSYGMTPSLLWEVAAMGGADVWFEQQLSPESIPDPAADEVLWWFPSLIVDPQTQYARDKDGTQPGWKTMADLVRWTLLRRLRTKRQVYERMVEFWTNVLYVPALNSNAFGFRMDYDRVIRKHALGRFEDMLQEAIVHPAMGVFLDNAVSTKQAVNENLGRELLELHTVGRGYFTEAEVVNSARILTGYRVDTWRTWNVSYDPAAHWTGPVTVGAFFHPNDSADGQAVTTAYLSYLARHPATARRLSYRMAQFFVSDTPPESLVVRMMIAYLASGTSIPAMMRVLVQSSEFDAAVRAKVTHPANDVVKTMRVLGVDVTRDTTEFSGMNQMIWLASASGLIPMNWPRPDGEPLDGSAFSSVGRVLGSFQVHANLAHGWSPTTATTYRSAASWLPAASVRFDDLVRHLHRQLLFAEAPATLITQCAAAVNLSVDTILTASHPFVKSQLPRVLTLLLNSPLHMKH